MDSEYDSEETVAAFDDPNLPSTTAYGAEFFGELVGYEVFPKKIGHEMPATECLAPWSLEELGYTKDAPGIHVDGQIDDQAHLPDYYAYSSFADSWEEGLQAIEDFDWSASKDNEKNTGTSDRDVHEEEEIEDASGRVADMLCRIDQDGDLDLIGDAAHLHRSPESPTSQPEDRTHGSKDLPLVKVTAPVIEITDTVASPPYTKQIGSDSRIVGNQYTEAQDAMDIDEVSITAATGCADIGLGTADNATVGQGTATMPDLPACQEEHVVGNIASEMGPSTNSNHNDGAKSLPVASSLASSHHSNHSVYEPDLKTPSQIVDASDLPTKDATADLKLLSTLRSFNSGDNGKATYSVLEASDQRQPRKHEPKAQDPPQDDSVLRDQLETADPRSPLAQLSGVPALPAYSEDTPMSDAPEVGFQHTTVGQAMSSAPSEDDTFGSPESSEGLFRSEENVDGPLQAQVQDAADNTASDGLAGLLPLRHRDCNVHSFKPSPEITDDDLCPRASSQLTDPLPAKQPKEGASLPPLPVASEYDAAGNEGSEAVLAEASKTELARRSPKFSSPSKVEPLDVKAEDHVPIPDLERSEPAVAVYENGFVEGDSSSDSRNMSKDLGCTTQQGSPTPPTSYLGFSTPAPAPKTQPARPRKRSKPLQNTSNTSETDSDAPPKKKARRGAPTEPYPNAVKKQSGAFEEHELELLPLLPRTRRGTAKSKKDITPMNEADGESESMFTGSDTEMRQPDHEDNDADMQEHYSDIEIPVTPRPVTPRMDSDVVDEVLSTPKSRPKVSNRELQGLSPTQYRTRPSKAKRDTLPISRQLFKLDTPDKLESSAIALEHSPVVPGVNDDLSAFIEGGGATGSTLNAIKPHIAKPKASTALVKKQEKSKGLVPATMEAFAARPTKKQKTEPMEEKEEGLFPAPKIDTTKPAPLPELAAPPGELFMNARRATRSKQNFDRDVDAAPVVEDSPVVANGDLDDDDLSSGISEYQDVPNLSDEEDDNFQDAQEIIDAQYDNDDADNDYSGTPLQISQRSKLKNKPSTLGNQSLSRLNSRKDTPTSSIAASAAAPSTNRYGFRPSPKGPRTPRTRAGRKAAANSGAPTSPVSQPKPVPAPKARVPAKCKAKTTRDRTEADIEEPKEASTAVLEVPPKGKVKRSTAIATATTEVRNQPSVRKTRHATAVEDQIKNMREEDKKVMKEKADTGIKAKLRQKV